MRYSISTFVTLAASVAALEVTYPTEGADINLSKDVTIKWTSVSSDPTSFAIHLVNENTYPNVDDVVASDVNTSAGSYTMKGISAADGSGYQINLISTSSENSGILAQSEQFNVTGSSSSSTTASTSSSTASGKSSSTGTSTSTAATSSSASAPISTSTSVSVSTVSVSGSSTLG
ncbi:hypothetical protein ASPZODRAFT_69800 [Penicilliopsis zonata CBS 506.65]|uniref:Yeast cell wall synthesis Kre9/Knh1-like N-terminal domain-containing protein n=1 Tax=Penicilliopsis zonata CBS 506.65 TaxID=1073090 RepID=A0A1L9SEB2_9EURO|nr:hypothetical protein ASPZODRAFT_69800 [Penicilliopsis zonata CBS 506.65]OJJ45448.1 hypothetical protein ASPZODRAFT_69800 [Penicilliopsis zonata CBS 506.65]